MGASGTPPEALNLQCPVYMVPMSYKDLNKFSVERQQAFSLVSKYDAADEENRAVLRQQCFLQYAKPYEWVWKTACHMCTNEQAFHNSQRLAQYFGMNIHLNPVTMDNMNDKLTQCATFCDVPQNASKAGTERTKIVLSQQATSMGIQLAQTSPVSAQMKAGATSSHSSAIRKFMQSLEVLNLEAVLRPKLLGVPDSRFIITTILRFRKSILSQLVLGTRSSVPGDEMWDQIQPLSVHGRDTLAFSLTAHTNAQNVMVQPDELKIFATKLSEASYRALVHLKLNNATASLHKLAFSIRNILSDGTKDKTPRAAIMYGDHSCNAASMKYGDRLAYFLGFKNGVYSNFLDPIQDILLEAPDAEPDDFLDIQEACTQVVTLGHAEMQKHFEIFLTTDSPAVQFPFDGDALVSPTGEFEAALQKLKTDVKNPHSTVFKRRIANLKALRAIPAQMQKLDGMMRQTEQRLRQQTRKAPIREEAPTSPTTSTQTHDTPSQLAEGYIPQPTWSVTQDDGSMIVGNNKSKRVDVDAMCTDLNVQREQICPTIVVLDPSCTEDSCQSKCPTPHLPGHRFITDFVHQKSLSLRRDYTQIKDKVTTNVPKDLAQSIVATTSTATQQPQQPKGKGRSRSRGAGRKGAAGGRGRKRKLSPAEQQLSASFSSNAEGDGPTGTVITHLTTHVHMPNCTCNLPNLKTNVHMTKYTCLSMLTVVHMT